MGEAKSTMLSRLRGSAAATLRTARVLHCRSGSALARNREVSDPPPASTVSSSPASASSKQASHNSRHGDKLTSAYNQMLITDPSMKDDAAQRLCLQQLSSVKHQLVLHQAALDDWRLALQSWRAQRDTMVEEKKKERSNKEAAAEASQKKGFLSALLGNTSKRRRAREVEGSKADRELLKQVESVLGPPPTCPRAPSGLYIFGEVGTGKSFMMDLFLGVTSHIAPGLMHRRLHFHEFTNEVHALLHSIGKASNEQDCNKLIPQVADQLLQLPETVDGGGDAALLCFDEFQCSDVFTASILQSLLGYLMERGVTMVATSNRAPQELNKDLLSGFQKDEFEKFLTELSRNCLPHHVESAVDYRKVHSIISGKPSKYWHPVTASNSKCLESAFTLAVEAIGGIEPAGREIQIGFGRRWHVDRCTRVGVPHDSGSSAHDSPTTAASVAFFDFKQLCDVPRGVPDYAALGREFDAVFIEGVPQLSLARRDEARRFILLIDELYNHGAVAWCTAQVPMDELFDGCKDGGFAVDLEQLQFETEAEGSKLRRDLEKSGEVSPFASASSTSNTKGTLFTGEEEHFAFNRSFTASRQLCA